MSNKFRGGEHWAIKLIFGILLALVLYALYKLGATGALDMPR